MSFGSDQSKLFEVVLSPQLTVLFFVGICVIFSSKNVELRTLFEQQRLTTNNKTLTKQQPEEKGNRNETLPSVPYPTVNLSSRNPFLSFLFVSRAHIRRIHVKKKSCRKRKYETKIHSQNVVQNFWQFISF